MIDECWAVLLIGVEDCLAVTSGCKTMAAPFQLPTQLDVVIDLAIGDEYEIAPLIVEWLPSCVEINDAKSTHCEHDMLACVRAFSIRSPMREETIDAIDPLDLLRR